MISYWQSKHNIRWDEKVVLRFNLPTTSLTNFDSLAPLITLGLFLKKLFQKVVQRVINTHYSSDPGNLAAFMKSSQNKWISVLTLCHNINAVVLTKTTQKQVTVLAWARACSECYFLMFFFGSFLMQKMKSLQIDGTQGLSVSRF